MTNFVHLHVHSEYSLLDGLSKIKKLFGYVKELGMDSLALTDHGGMYGAIEFYKAGRDMGVKPIIGMEAYITGGKLTDKAENGKTPNYHLLLLCKSEEGYKNLMKLSSIAHVDGYYYKPRIDRETLKKYSKGLIVTSACAQGELARAIVDEDKSKVKNTIEWYMDTFEDDYYLEIQRHKYKDYLDKASDDQIKQDLIRLSDGEELINEEIIKLSRKYGIPLVATNDAHYIKPTDATAQDALVCIATGKNVSDIKRLRFIDAPTFYITTPDEMADLFPDYPDALENTVKIAAKCEMKISTFGKWFFPKFEVPGDLDEGSYLEKLVWEKLPDRITEVTDEVKERIKHELGIIVGKGYAPYFLIVMDMVNWASEKGIITNTRGSAAGSIVSFILGITTVNPLTYYLPFERFLNPFRPSPPDIDFDVSDDRREEVIGYITDKYGHERVAQICTFGRMLSRAAVRDIARVLGYPYAVGDRISKMIPPPKQGFPIDIPKAFIENPDLKSLYDTDPESKRVLDLAHEVEGNARHISVHAAGVVVAPTSLTDFTPIQREPSGEKIITQYEMHACEDVGLIKFDILGIRNLSILGESIRMVNSTRNLTIRVDNIPIDDTKTFEMLGRGETMGVFQISSSGMTKYIKDLKPERVTDLMAMVALYRPGPIAVIPEYIKRKKNPKLVKYLDPRMEKFLGDSYGLIVYQDDLLFCALDLAGYTWEEADKFRKAVGKKIPEEMAAQKDKFTKGIVSNGQTEEFAETLWKLFEPFQAYGFNKAHAASYGMVAYYTGYMKANYPVEYMTALLTAESGDAEKISAAINECRRMGVKVLPPDINQSGDGFTIISDTDSLGGLAIRFGLNAVKNVGKAAIEAILEAREEGPFTSLVSFLTRIDGRRVNKKVLESLIKVGALSAFGTRSYLIDNLEDIRSKVVKPKAKNDAQADLFGESYNENKIELEGLINIVPVDMTEFPDSELEALERQLLGFSLTGKPLSEIVGPLEYKATHKISELTDDVSSQELVRLAGVVREVRVITTKKGSEMAFAKLEDVSGIVSLVIFPKVFSDTRDFWTDAKPLLVMGKLDSRNDEVSVLVDSIETIETSVNSEKEVYVRVPKGVTSENLSTLKGLFQANPGAQTVTLIFEEKNRRVSLPQIKITWSEGLAHQINNILEGNHDIGVQ